jgi:glucosamine 6-phosphate synthetase-like amidotransferase/phosphosugar isomerase protein
LAQLCDEVLLLPYHPLSRDTPHTLDYLLTLLAQTAIAERLAGSTFNELDSVPELLSETINVASQQVDHCANLVNEMSLLLFLGAGADLGTCMYGAAKFHEADGLRACHGEIENFWHGMHLIVGQQDCITVLSSRVEPPQTEQFLVSTLQQLTPNVLYIGSREINVPHTIFLPVSDTVVRPFITAIAPQLLCHAVACRLGIDVDAPASARPKSHNYHAQAAWFEHLDYAASRFVD